MNADLGERNELELGLGFLSFGQFCWGGMSSVPGPCLDSKLALATPDLFDYPILKSEVLGACS